MAFTGSTFGGPTQYYVTQAQITFDNTGWNLRDVASSSVTYYGYTQSISDQNKSVWKIRKDTLTGNVTSVQYADGDANYDNAWSGRTSLTYK